MEWIFLDSVWMNFVKLSIMFGVIMSFNRVFRKCQGI